MVKPSITVWLALTAGMTSMTDNDAVADAVQVPPCKVTVTEYTPLMAAVAKARVGFLSVELNDAGPAQLYEYAPALALSETVPPAHAPTALALTVIEQHTYVPTLTVAVAVQAVEPVVAVVGAAAQGELNLPIGARLVDDHAGLRVCLLNSEIVSSADESCQKDERQTKGS